MYCKRLFFSILCVVSSLAMAETPILDNSTTSLVLDKIISIPALAHSNITVTTIDGIVKLTGVVNSEPEAILLIQTAQSVTGVKDVDAEHLTVAVSHQPFVDMVITAKIKGLYLQSKLFGSQDIPITSIIVTTNNGIVTLSGKVYSPHQMENAVKLAKSVQGVNEVQCFLKVIR